ncbi:MAG: glycosyltransferase family 1 protein [Ardenticatenaceae bacterium]|nr:glycosyltransferase family 1 protein [Ardenticatenaceae bacterium]
MKILINGLAARLGGSETFLVELLPRLAKQKSSITFDLFVVESRRKNYENLPKNVRLIGVADVNVNSTFRRLIFEHLVIPYRFLFGKYDFYIESGDMMSPFVWLSRKKTLSVFHATQHLIIPKETGERGIRLIYNKIMRRLTAYGVTIPVTVSHFTATQLVEIYPVLKGKLKVIHHGLAMKKNANGSDSAFPLDFPHRYMLSISNRYPFKNYANLIRAYGNFLRKNDTDIDLVLIGAAKSAAVEKEIREIIAQFDIKDRVHIFDYIPRQRLAKIFSAATGYIFPSKFETFGFTPLEAMSYGVPCAVSNQTSLPEICGDAALYFDPGDLDQIEEAIHQLVFNERLREDLIKKGNHQYTKFTWDQAAAEYHAAIENA